MNKVKLAVIGCGGLAQSQHIPNMSKVENTELYALCDIRIDVIKSLGETYGVKNLETDYTKILENKEIDGVFIVTKEDMHMPLTLEALAAGKHVYVEKPLAETREECERIVTAQKKANKIVAVGMNRRMAPAYRYAKKLLWNKQGPKNMFYRIADSYSLDWGLGCGEGNRLFHEVCHIIDILCYFAESSVKSVYCISSRPDDELINMQFESGAIATIMGSGYVNSGMPKEHFEAIAETGGLTIDDFAEVRQYSLDENEPENKTFPGHSHPQHDLLHEYLLEELGDAGMRAVRRVSWRAVEQFNRLEQKNKTNSKEYKNLKEFVRRIPLRNYFMNKGWTDALRGFVEAIITGKEFEGAKASDGLNTSLITEAVLKSRNSGKVVIL